MHRNKTVKFMRYQDIPVALDKDKTSLTAYWYLDFSVGPFALSDIKTLLLGGIQDSSLGKMWLTVVFNNWATDLENI